MDNLDNLFYYILLIFLGNTVRSQNLTVCHNPRIGLPCHISCIAPDTAETVTFHKNGEEVKSCSCRVNTTDCYTRRKGNNKSDTVLRLSLLNKYHQGFWKCSSGVDMAASVELKPYSFERGEIHSPSIVPGQNQRRIITVKAHCVFPEPEFFVRYCSKEMCTGKGHKFFSGDCGDEHTHSYKYDCEIDFENPATECWSVEAVPVETLVFVNGRHVFYEVTKELYNGKGNKDDVYFYKPAFITVLSGIGIFIIAYCIIRIDGICIRLWKRRADDKVNTARSQNLTVCHNPRIGLPCQVTCITPNTAKAVTFHKNGEEVKSCRRKVNTTDCYTRRKGNGKSDTILRLNLLKKFDQGFWKCSFGIYTSASVELKPYSFERGEILAPSVMPGQNQRRIITVKAHCVFPEPEFVVRYCSKDLCKGKGHMFFNGDCGDDHTQNYRYDCQIDFDNPSTLCESTDSVPVQASVYINGHHVFHEFTKELYNGKGNQDDLYIYKPALITVLTGMGILIVVYCIMRKRLDEICSKCCERLRRRRADDGLPASSDNRTQGTIQDHLMNLLKKTDNHETNQT